jgi:predicted nucleic acid-binding protein
MRILLDTTVLIDVLRSRRGRRELLAELSRKGDSLTTTSLNIAEVYAGMRPGEESRTKAFLDPLDCYELSRSTAQTAGALKNRWARKGHTLALADAIVAAIALDNHCILMTDNRKHFPMPELEYYPLPRG